MRGPAGATPAGPLAVGLKTLVSDITCSVGQRRGDAGRPTDGAGRINSHQNAAQTPPSTALPQQTARPLSSGVDIASACDKPPSVPTAAAVEVRLVFLAVAQNVAHRASRKPELALLASALEIVIQTETPVQIVQRALDHNIKHEV